MNWTIDWLGVMASVLEVKYITQYSVPRAVFVVIVRGKWLSYHFIIDLYIIRLNGIGTAKRVNFNMKKSQNVIYTEFCQWRQWTIPVSTREERRLKVSIYTMDTDSSNPFWSLLLSEWDTHEMPVSLFIPVHFMFVARAHIRHSPRGACTANRQDKRSLTSV